MLLKHNKEKSNDHMRNFLSVQSFDKFEAIDAELVNRLNPVNSIVAIQNKNESKRQLL